MVDTTRDTILAAAREAVALGEKATPGPMRPQRFADPTWVVGRARDGTGPAMVMQTIGGNDEANVRFYAHAGTHYAAIAAALLEAEAEIQRLTLERENRVVFCVHCGKGWPRGSEPEVVYREAVAHEAECEQNPLVQEIQRLRGEEPDPAHAYLTVRTLDEVPPGTLLIIAERPEGWREVGRICDLQPAPAPTPASPSPSPA